MDLCSTFSKNVTETAQTGPCLGATWVINSPSDETKNGQCFFKGSRAAATATFGETIVAGVLNS